MKKSILLFALLFVSLFASANEIQSKSIIVETTRDTKSKEMSLTEEDKTVFFDLTYCVTRKSYLFVESFMGMDGQVYERYEVVTTTTCYTIKD